MIPELVYKPADVDVMFKNAGGLPAHDTFSVSSYDVPPLRDFHPAGWYECFPSGSSPVVQNGAHIGFHGEVWGLPFELEHSAENENECSVSMTAYTHRTPWKLTKRFSLKRNDPTVYVEETATNLGSVDLTVMWGQHPFYGAPFIDEQCYLEMPAKSYLDMADKPMRSLPWPDGKAGQNMARMGKPHSNTSKMIFVTDCSEGLYRIVSPTWKLALEMRWDARKFPWCWVYETCHETAAPWFGRSYGIAVEPFTGLPKAIEEGKGVMVIGAHQSETVRFSASVVPHQ